MGSVLRSENTSGTNMEPLSLLHKWDADLKTVKRHKQNNKQHNVQNPQNDVRVWMKGGWVSHIQDLDLSSP